MPIVYGPNGDAGRNDHYRTLASARVENKFGRFDNSGRRNGEGAIAIVVGQTIVGTDGKVMTTRTQANIRCYADK